VAIEVAEDLLRLGAQLFLLARDHWHGVSEDVERAQTGVAGAGNGLQGGHVNRLDSECIGQRLEDHHQPDAARAEAVEQTLLDSHHVANRDRRKVRPPARCGAGAGRHRSGGSVAAAKDVRAHDEVAVRVEGVAGSYQIAPPQIGVGRSGERMAHRHRVVGSR